MKLYICEKPSQAADIAKVLGSPRKVGGSHWETSGGMVTWCFGHLVANDEPEDYDPKYKSWKFSDLPIIPQTFRRSPKRDAAVQLKAIGQLLKQCTGVVISTDADREGEMIGREVLVHHKYSGPVDRLWISSLDEESVRKALAKVKPGQSTISLYHAALARSQADWLVGMNMSRGVSLKLPSPRGNFSIGRVQTPTVAIVVNRDLAIERFKAREFYEIQAQIRTEGGKEVSLVFGPKDEEKRLWDHAKAAEMAKQAEGVNVTLSREATPRREGPPKLFALSGLQKKANSLWGWAADKTLEIAQSLYETHKATTYPRSDCEFLPEEQIPDICVITGNLTRLPAFERLAGMPFEPRKTVFNTAKISAHHAIIPTKVSPPIDRMSTDERKAYQLIAATYLASLLPDYEFTSTKLSAMVNDVEFATTGKTPGKPGWKVAFGADQAEEDDDGKDKVLTLPDIPNGSKGAVVRASIVSKKTTPPSRYTEGTLIEDMKSIAKFVTDPNKKARLKETSGIGTEATRANIIVRIKLAGYVEVKGKQIISSQKGRDLIAMLSQELPALADPGETATWEDGLVAIEEGRETTDQFMTAIGGRIREYIGVLGKKVDVPQGGAGAVAGKPTGVQIGGVEIMDHEGEYYTASGAFSGRIYANFSGHRLTPQEVHALVAEKQVLDLSDCTTKEGAPAGPKQVRYNPSKKPYPGVEVVIQSEATGVSTEVKRGGKGGSVNLLKFGDKEYYTVDGYVSGGYPVKFWKKSFNRDLTPEELAAILASGDKGIAINGFKTNEGTVFSKFVRYNPKKKPYAGLEFSD